MQGIADPQPSFARSTDRLTDSKRAESGVGLGFLRRTGDSDWNPGIPSERPATVTWSWDGTDDLVVVCVRLSLLSAELQSARPELWDCVRRAVRWFPSSRHPAAPRHDANGGRNGIR